VPAVSAGSPGPATRRRVVSNQRGQVHRVKVGPAAVMSIG
jgi:hypothetical protein